MFHRRLVILLLISVGIVLPGCSSSKSVNNRPFPISWNDLFVTPQPDNTLCWDISLYGNKPSWENIRTNFKSGLVMNLDMPDAREIGWQTYETISKKPLEAKLRLWYGEENSKQANFRFFVLLDEKQLTSVFGLRQYYKDLIIPVGSETSISFTVPTLSPGVHDLVIIGIPYVDDYPNPEGIVRILSHRVTLVTNPLLYSFRKINFNMLPSQGSLVRGDPKIPLMLSLKDNALKVWNWPNPWFDTETGNIDFLILAGYEYTINSDVPDLDATDSSFFALMLFIDYQQTEIESDQLTIYGTVGSDTAYTSIPVKLASLSQGKHYVLVLRMEYPGVPMCILQGPPRGRVLPSGVTGTLVGVNVFSSRK